MPTRRAARGVCRATRRGAHIERDDAPRFAGVARIYVSRETWMGPGASPLLWWWPFVQQGLGRAISALPLGCRQGDSPRSLSPEPPHPIEGWILRNRVQARVGWSRPLVTALKELEWTGFDPLADRIRQGAGEVGRAVMEPARVDPAFHDWGLPMKPAVRVASWILRKRAED